MLIVKEKSPSDPKYVVSGGLSCTVAKQRWAIVLLLLMSGNVHPNPKIEVLMLIM